MLLIRKVWLIKRNNLLLILLIFDNKFFHTPLIHMGLGNGINFFYIDYSLPPWLIQGVYQQVQALSQEVQKVDRTPNVYPPLFFHFAKEVNITSLHLHSTRLGFWLFFRSIFYYCKIRVVNKENIFIAFKLLSGQK